MNERLRTSLQRSLADRRSTGRSRATSGTRPPPGLEKSAQVLLGRTLHFARTLVPDARIDRDALDIACLALMLPYADAEASKPTAMGVVSINDRCGQAAELLAGLMQDDASDGLVDRATRILGECPRRSTTLDEARVLADALNIEDFGLSGICRSVALLMRPGSPISQLADAFTKREQYGYWEIRLKESFHFEPPRRVAEERLRTARQCIKLLLSEIESETG